MAAPVASTESGFYNVAIKGKEKDVNAAESISFANLVEDLRRTFHSGKTKSLEWRKQQLRQLILLHKENHERIAEAFHKDHKGPKLRALLEMTAVGQAEMAISNLDSWAAPEAVKHDSFLGKSYIRKESKGIVLLITPWNYPFTLTFEGMIPIIASGNCMVVKPSEVSAHSCALMAELIPKYFDQEAIRVVTGGVAETTALLRERFDHIFYTGNGAVGRVVMAAAAKHLTPTTLELGGKSPVYIDRSAKLDTAVARIGLGKWINAGQTCIAPDYILVHKDVAEEFQKKVTDLIQKHYGKDSPSRQANKEFGRIINDRHVERIHALVKGTKGKVVTGGNADARDNYLEPTIIVDPDMNDAIMREEIFGPVLPIIKVNSALEAAQRVNKVCEHPLALYVFAEDQKAIDVFLNNTTSGGVCVNSTLEHIGNNHLPFGGIGESGMGAYHGKAGFDEFTHKRSVYVKDTFLVKGSLLPPGPPYPEWLYDVAIKAQVTGFVTDSQKTLLKAGGALAAALVGIRMFQSRL